MRAIVIDHFGGLDSLVIKEIPKPEPKAGQVVPGSSSAQVSPS